MIALILAVVVLGVYLGYVISTDGCIPSSISQSFYTSGKWMFSAVIITTSILLLVSLAPVTPDNLLFLPFLISAGLLAVAGAPHCNDDKEKYLHIAGAVVFALASIAWYIVVPMQTDIKALLTALVIIWIAALALALSFSRCIVFIGEMGVIVTLLLGRIVLI